MPPPTNRTCAAVQSALAIAYIAVPLWEGSVGPLVEAGRLAALRALELDPGQAEAYAALGRIALYFDWDPVTSERQFRRALALEPDNICTLQGYAELLALDGRFDEALALNARALAKDPVSVVASLARAYTLYAARRFDESVAQLQQSLELDRSSSLARVGLAKNYAAQGKAPEGIVALVDWLTAAGATPATIAALHSAANAGGLPGFWKQWLELYGSEVSDYYVARAHLSAGNREDALIWLEKAYAGKCPGIRNLGMPEWDPLRGDDRFQNLVRRAGLAVTTEPPPPPA